MVTKEDHELSSSDGYTEFTAIRHNVLWRHRNELHSSSLWIDKTKAMWRGRRGWAPSRVRHPPPHQQSSHQWVGGGGHSQAPATSWGTKGPFPISGTPTLKTCTPVTSPPNTWLWKPRAVASRSKGLQYTRKRLWKGQRSPDCVQGIYLLILEGTPEGQKPSGMGSHGGPRRRAPHPSARICQGQVFVAATQAMPLDRPPGSGGREGLWSWIPHGGHNRKDTTTPRAPQEARTEIHRTSRGRGLLLELRPEGQASGLPRTRRPGTCAQETRAKECHRGALPPSPAASHHLPETRLCHHLLEPQFSELVGSHLQTARLRRPAGLTLTVPRDCTYLHIFRAARRMSAFQLA